MKNIRYPEDLVVTSDDFKNVEIEKLIEEGNEKDVDYYHSIFSEKAKDLIGQGKVNEGKVLWLLSDACSPILKPESANGPFVPICSGGGRRTFLPEDFSDKDIAFLESIIPEIVDYHLRARIADICWFMGRPRKPEVALTAIDAYLKYRFEDEDHAHNCKAQYERAIFLCSIHRELTKERSELIHDYLLETLQKNIGQPGTLIIVSDLLLKHGIGDSTEVVYNTLVKSAENIRFDSQRKLLENAYEGIKRKKKPDNRLYDIHSRIAEGYIEDASCISSIFSADLYHKAILEYYKIPKRIRNQYVSEDRIKELNCLIEEANQQALTEMTPISSPPINIADVVKASREHVRGRDFPEAIIAFAHISNSQDMGEYKEEAIKILRDSILLALVSRTHYAHDGRVVAKSPGANLGGESDPSTELAIWEQMMSSYHFHVSLCVEGMILQSLEVINAEHRITLPNIFDMCRASTAVPNDRLLLWAKGIYFGFENDFMSAVHLLTPQIEHLVRVNLKRYGIKTTNTDESGIETENGLKTLLDNNDINRVFDENTVFELKAIFTDCYGFNLRNEIAHGLVDSNIGHTYSAVYAWWFCLKLIMQGIISFNKND
ncbi:MAG: hypothetical protein CVU50_00445 [Candidatus Cloacimonetes bacterium HGW-Cloacimonetes-3]|jgi:hypothetical protein|nr:MAG: hypothetical protein CVU50_00445 [Candidatus Cloacimonetes bacterium HGW-Cloacimonetes-3]